MLKLFYDSNFGIAITPDMIVDDLSEDQIAISVKNYKKSFATDEKDDNITIFTLSEIDDANWDDTIKGITVATPELIVSSLEEAKKEKEEYKYCVSNEYGSKYFLFNNIDDDYRLLTGDYDGFDHNLIYWDLNDMELTDNQINDDYAVINLAKDELLKVYSNHYPICNDWSDDFKVEMCYESYDIDDDKIITLNISMDDFNYNRCIDISISKNDKILSFSTLSDY